LSKPNQCGGSIDFKLGCSGLREVQVSTVRVARPSTPSKEYIGEAGEHTYGDEETDGNRTFSEGEGDTSRATDPESALSPKKKKKGLRTPSFLKKKKKDKKEKDEKKKEKTPA